MQLEGVEAEVDWVFAPVAASALVAAADMTASEFHPVGQNGWDQQRLGLRFLWAGSSLAIQCFRLAGSCLEKQYRNRRHLSAEIRHLRF
jgi:hypothetical protein